ncbi:hypothetical protein AFERRI_400135 [Acidithiobacillus ferrivorans]|uniref:Uncharacterized protein n=1 Tax=Acidithiobacillus ferrivorans TaxID=160808 RepID=A0A060UUV5_9PROT|nr:hypothetical protein AFERRI_400135 [Acidithiobacillus ferrivorans]
MKLCVQHGKLSGLRIVYNWLIFNGNMHPTVYDLI